MSAILDFKMAAIRIDIFHLFSLLFCIEASFKHQNVPFKVQIIQYHHSGDYSKIVFLFAKKNFTSSRKQKKTQQLEKQLLYNYKPGVDPSAHKI